MKTPHPREARIAQLRAEYSTLHDEAVRRLRAGNTNLDDLQQREMDIDRVLRALGTRLGA